MTPAGYSPSTSGPAPEWRSALGPRPSPWCLDNFRDLGYRLLFGANDPATAVIGGLLVRVADLESELAERAA